MKEEIFKAIEELALDWQSPYDGFMTINAGFYQLTLFKDGVYKPLHHILDKYSKWESYNFLYRFAAFIVKYGYYQVRWRDKNNVQHKFWSQFTKTKSGKPSKKQPQYTLDYIYDQFIISQN